MEPKKFRALVRNTLMEKSTFMQFSWMLPSVVCLDFGFDSDSSEMTLAVFFLHKRTNWFKTENHFRLNRHNKFLE